MQLAGLPIGAFQNLSSTQVLYASLLWRTAISSANDSLDVRISLMGCQKQCTSRTPGSISKRLIQNGQIFEIFNRKF